MLKNLKGGDGELITYKMVLLKSLVVIGQGAPNQLKDGRQSVCVCACKLDSKKMIRIYPVPMGWLRKWDIFDVEVEKNPRDHRENTWKIKNSKQDWKKLYKWITKKNEKYPKNQREELIKSIGFSVLSSLIENKKSFGIIKPIIKGFELKQQNKSTIKQLTLGEMENLDEPFTIINQKDFKFKPYILYECEGDCKCKNKIHKQSISERGCYEFMRKYPGREMELSKALYLFDKDYILYFLVGNIHKAPQTYIIIDIFRFKKEGAKNEL